MCARVVVFCIFFYLFVLKKKKKCSLSTNLATLFVCARCCFFVVVFLIFFLDQFSLSTKLATLFGGRGAPFVAKYHRDTLEGEGVPTGRTHLTVWAVRGSGYLSSGEIPFHQDAIGCS